MISSNDLVVVSPDVGGVARARAFAKKLSDAPLAIIDKRRQSHNIAEVRTHSFKFLEWISCVVEKNRGPKVERGSVYKFSVSRVRAFLYRKAIRRS